MSERLKRLEEAGLLGCFDGTGVHSENYKEALEGDVWIRIEDKEPPLGVEILVYRYYWQAEFSSRFIGGYSGKSFKIPSMGVDITYGRGKWESGGGEVTHWMLLPEPPK